MSGKQDPGATNMNWGSLLILGLATDAPVGLAAPFTAAARGITQVEFTVDPAPALRLDGRILVGPTRRLSHAP